MYILNSDHSSCEEIIPNCKILDSNKEKCEQCKENFYLLDDDKYTCHNDSIDKDKYSERYRWLQKKGTQLPKETRIAFPVKK